MSRRVVLRRGQLLHLHFQATDLAPLIVETVRPFALLIDHLVYHHLLGGAVDGELKFFFLKFINAML